VSGNVHIERSSTLARGLVVAGTAVGGNVLIKKNGGKFIDVSDNNVGGDIQVENNYVSKKRSRNGINVSFNQAGGNIQCFGHKRRDFKSTDNVADGEIVGQCSDFVVCPCLKGLPEGWKPTKENSDERTLSCEDGTSIGAIDKTWSHHASNVSLTLSLKEQCNGPTLYRCNVSAGEDRDITEAQYAACEGFVGSKF
jgi:hypothetical protein